MRGRLPDAPPKFSSAAVELALHELGIDVKIGPKEAVTHCVFHNDTGKPNLYINVTNKPGVYHCFSCDAQGSFEAFVQQYTGWTMVKTLLACREWQRRVALEPPPERAKPLPQGPDDERLAPFQFRHKYVYARGLLEETAQRYEIGYDKTENAITIPWFSASGKLVSIKRRSILSKYYLFERGADLTQTLFGLNHVRLNAYVWMTEGEFDAMFIDQCFRIAHFERHHAIAIGGKYLHDTQISALLRKVPTAVVLMLDNDGAGREAQSEVKRRLIPRVKTVEAPYPSDDVKDPNSMTFEEIVHAARSLTTMMEG